MNKRIKELVDQAEVWNADGDKCEVDLSKFAELIVKECVNVADEVSMDDTIGYALLEHFGVKE